MRKPRTISATAVAVVAVAALLAAAFVSTASPAAARDSSRTVRRPQVPAAVTVSTPAQAIARVPGKRRPVVLQQRFGTGWKNVARKRSTRAGNVTFALNTSWYGPHRYRLLAPKFHRHRKWTSAASTMRVVPTYQPIGSSSSYRVLTTARWNACKPVRWVYLPASTATHEPVSGDTATFENIDANAFAAVTGALAEVTRATGIRFSYAGRAASYANRAGTLEIGWTDRPDQTAGMTTGQSGVGGFYARRSRTGVPEILRGSVVLNAEKLYADMEEMSSMAADWDVVAEEWDSWRLTAAHEIAHAVGLGHVSDESQLMNPVQSAGAFGAGDLAGLYHQGISRGCVTGSRR